MKSTINMMKKPFMTFVFLSTVTGVASAQEFTVDFSTTKPYLAEGNAIILDGVRVNGLGLKTANDAVKLKFIFNPATLNFELDNYVLYQSIGISNEQHMVMDAPARIALNNKGEEIEVRQPFYTANVEAETGKGDAKVFVPPGELLEAGNTYTLTTPVVADFNLSVGHVMSFNITAGKEDVNYRFTGPILEDEGTPQPLSIEVEGTIKRRERHLVEPIKILLPGHYQLTVLPANPEETAPLQFRAFNANSDTIKELKDGDKLRTGFVTNTWEYSKYKVTLVREDTLEIPGVEQLSQTDNERWETLNANNQNVAMKLVDKTNHVVAYADNFESLTYYHNKPAEDFYLFIYDKVGGPGKYSPASNEVQITNPNAPEAEPKPKPKPDPEPDPETEDPSTEEPSIEEPGIIDEEGQFEDELENELDTMISEG